MDADSPRKYVYGIIFLYIFGFDVLNFVIMMILRVQHSEFSDKLLESMCINWQSQSSSGEVNISCDWTMS